MNVWVPGITCSYLYKSMFPKSIFMFLKSIFQWLPFNVLFNWNRKDQDRYEIISL